MGCGNELPRLGAVPRGCCDPGLHSAYRDLHCLQMAEELERGVSQDLFHWNK